MPPEPVARSSLPADLLLPLFTLTLLANALLVAFAIRGMRTGASGPGRSDGAVRPSGSPPPTAAPAAAPVPVPVLAAREPALAGTTPGTPVEPLAGDVAAALGGSKADDGPPADPTPPPTDPGEVPSAPPATQATTRNGGTASRTQAADAAAAGATRRTAAGSRRKTRATTANAGPAEAAPGDPAGATANGATRAAAGEPLEPTSGESQPSVPPGPASPAPVAARRRSRRRFSLPPLDEDHEKVNRSIKSFLAGGDAPDAATGGPAPRAEGATTIALIVIDRPADPGRRATPGRVGPAAPAGEPAEEVSAMIERTLRAAARGSDVVAGAGRGRFRITLAATGELAARAYLRRVRATVEPLLESIGPPLRLTIATATALDEPLEGAIERAERRLAAALASPHPDDPARLDETASDDGRPERTPRAAAD